MRWEKAKGFTRRAGGQVLRLVLGVAIAGSAVAAHNSWAQAAAPAAATSAIEVAGIWQGKLHIEQVNRDLRLQIRVEKLSDGAYKSTFYSLDQGGQPIGSTTTTFAHGIFAFTSTSLGAKYEGKLSTDGKSMAGSFVQGTTPLPLNLERVEPDAAWPIPESIKMMAPDADPSFEVVTIKPSKPGARGKGFGFRGAHFITVNTDMNDLIAFAYGVHTQQIVGAPEWFGSELFDLEGVPDMPGQPTLKQMERMVAKMLPERFALKFHHEQRKLSVYILTVTPSGAKMTKTTAGANDQQGFGFRGLGDLAVRNMSMAEFAGWMQNAVMDRPVVDQTGLKDKFDFMLKWTPDESQFQQFRSAGPMPPAPSDQANTPPSLYTAVQEQLGLKIEAGKAMDDVIVIDHVEKPSSN